MGELVRAMTRDGFVKAVAVESRDIVERARQIHKMLPTATAALGRLLTAASMMGNMQKIENGSLTLQIKGGGPLGTVLAVSDAAGNVRGYVQNPQISLLEKYRGKLDVGAAVGRDGMLTVIRDLQMKEPYIGSVPLVSGEIAEDITEYFAQSEQTPTACALGVLVDTDQSVRAAGGYLLQLLPGASEESIAKAEAMIANFSDISAQMQEHTAEEVLRRWFGDVKFYSKKPEYKCNCSKDYIEGVLAGLGRKEIEDILAEQGEIRVHCHYCNTDYVFTPADAERLISRGEKTEVTNGRKDG